MKVKKRVLIETTVFLMTTAIPQPLVHNMRFWRHTGHVLLCELFPNCFRWQKYPKPSSTPCKILDWKFRGYG